MAAQLVGWCLAKQRVTSSTSCQGSKFGPQSGVCERQPINVSLPFSPSLPLSLKINKQNLKINNQIKSSPPAMLSSYLLSLRPHPGSLNQKLGMGLSNLCFEKPSMILMQTKVEELFLSNIAMKQFPVKSPCKVSFDGPFSPTDVQSLPLLTFLKTW